VPNERALNYRVLALKALKRAENAQTAASRSTFLELARAWHTLATDIEFAISSPHEPHFADRDRLDRRVRANPGGSRQHQVQNMRDGG